MLIRNERKSDHREVEELTRNAFWNLHVPGCNEHYLVHVMRGHEDFVPELDFVMEINGRIIANVMYVKSKLVDNNNKEKTVLTFGPISVLPEYQRKGYGKKLLEFSFQKAVELGFDAIVIYGNPENYISCGFKNCKKYHISIGDEIFPTPLLVKELHVGAIPEGDWRFQESAAYDIDEKAAEEYDKTFEPLIKEYRPSQELFDIYSHSRVL